MVIGSEHLEYLWLEVFSTSMELLAKVPQNTFEPFILAEPKVYTHERIFQSQVSFKPYTWGDILLREVHFAKMHEKVGSKNVEVPFTGTFTISRYSPENHKSEMVHQEKIEGKRMNLKPVSFHPDYTYHLTTLASIRGFPSQIGPIWECNQAFEDKLRVLHDPKHTLIDRLFFEAF